MGDEQEFEVSSLGTKAGHDTMDASQCNPAELVRPCLQKIAGALSGYRKYSSVQEDIDSLVERLEGLMIVHSGNLPRCHKPDGNKLPHVNVIGNKGLTDTQEDVEDKKISDTESSIFDKDEEYTSDDYVEAHSSEAGALADGAAREIMLVLHDAISTQKVVVIDASLDCLQKLVSFSLIRGSVFSINHKRGGTSTVFQDADGKEGSPLQFAAQPPQAQAVELICSCADTGDDAADLRLLKALLTVVTSSTLQVHSQALLLCVRSAYNIFLTSKSEVTQATAKATLVQIVNAVFHRLEQGTLSVSLPPVTVADVMQAGYGDRTHSLSTSVSIQQFISDVAAAVDPFGTAAATLQADLDEAFVPRHASGNQLNYSDGDLPTSPLHSIMVNNKSSHEMNASEKDAGLMHVLEKDGFLLLRALCKLSISSPDSLPLSDSTSSKGRILALELIKILLENCGERIQSMEKILKGIRQYLCLSLLKCCSSSSTHLQNLCSSIFTTLLLKFRSKLKAEVGVFYPMILLKVIETPVGGASQDFSIPTLAMASADASNKTVVLKCLEKISEDGQLLVDLFVNYDCDIEGGNNFERTISATVRLAQGGHLSTGIEDLAEVQEMRFHALKVLTQTVNSLRIWHANAISVSRDHKKIPDADAEGRSEDIRSYPQDDNIQQVGGEVEDSIKSKWMDQLAAGQRSLPQQTDGKQADLVKIWKEFKKAFEKGVSLFNEKPKKGIEFLQGQKLVGEGPEDVAKFLAVTMSLNKTVIGDYLGERDDYNLSVMHAFVDNMDFASLGFDAAIRSFLSGFRLPGEAQKIDRLMEKFAERYVRCNPDAFKSADVAYVLAYSVIMLNTDAHNPMVKKKMSKEDFLRNNRGINDGGDLDQEFMESLYDRIVTDEIKMNDETEEGDSQKVVSAPNWFDSVISLLPGRQEKASIEAPDDIVKRTAEKLRKLAEGASFVEAKDSDSLRPIVDVLWAPILGAFSVLFESEQDQRFIDASIYGFRESIILMARLDMGMLQNAFLSSLIRFTSLNTPNKMGFKNVKAFRTLLQLAEEIGDSLGNRWSEILRCVSRFELIASFGAGVPMDALMFHIDEKSISENTRKTSVSIPVEEMGLDASSNIDDMKLQVTTKSDLIKLSMRESSLPNNDTLKFMEMEDLTRFYLCSVKLSTESVISFVQALCSVALEELDSATAPRVFSLTQIVEIAHFNMGRIRIVWGRIWAQLSDFFVKVGCHENLAVGMYSVDSLRQLAVKFLDRDELANYNFQNEFLRPFIILIRRSKSTEIRELVIRCVSQMVLARASNIKSGWKSVFMVLTSAASDKSSHIVRLAFNTVERIVREEFSYITETETTTFTDCVNCLVAFTNNPHSLDVSLNAIAFLRFCAGELAEGDIKVQSAELPLDASSTLNLDAHRIRPVGSRKSGTPSPAAAAAAATAAAVIAAATPEPSSQRGNIRFTDKDEHMYFWFPLLVGLSELTFDPRSEIRYGAIGVLFDILKLHGNSFTREFWIRIYDSILLPMFDHVRAEVTDTTTFSDEARRAEADAWLYETCTTSLQYLVDVVSIYHEAVPELLTRLLDLLSGFIRRNHPSLAAVGVAALTQLAIACGENSSLDTWTIILDAFASTVSDTIPDVESLLTHRAECRAESPGKENGHSSWSLGSGAGSRRLAELKCRASVQLLLSQACGELYAAHSQRILNASLVKILDILEEISERYVHVNGNMGLRDTLALAQTADNVSQAKLLSDPPFLQVEVESSQAYMSVLLSIDACSDSGAIESTDVHERICKVCLLNLERFERQSALCQAIQADQSASESLLLENVALAPLAVATLKALMGLPKEIFAAKAKEFYPILTNLIAADVAPQEVQNLLSEIFSKRITDMVE